MIFIWLFFIALMSIAVLSRIITQDVYVFFGISMYFIIYFFNFNQKKNNKKTITFCLGYIFNHSFFILTIMLLYIYLDLSYYVKEKLAKILINKTKEENYNWWKPYDWWEL